ncbi:vacuolar transporter chaperone, partial [Rhizopus stolonifer]
MKFGTEFNSKINEPWRASYIQYNRLNAQLKNQRTWTDKDKINFQQQIESELKKVYGFVQARLDALKQRVDKCDTLLKKKKTAITYDAVADSLAEILIDVDDLTKFHELNLAGFDKITKKHDKQTQGGLRTVYFNQLLETYPLDKQRFDVLMVRISDMHDL